MSKSPGLVKPERKTRRTHKNSRDGCPNCRAKRIKCTEELPSCSNCVKKKYRCGYLDFPQERLDHIRRKNEIKRQQESEGLYSSSGTSLGGQKADTDIKSVLSALEKKKNPSSSLRQRRAELAAQNLDSVFNNRSENFRSLVYSAVFSDLNNNDLSMIRDMQHTEFKPWQDLLNIFENSIFLDHPSVTEFPTGQDLSSKPTPPTHMDLAIETPDFDTSSTLNEKSHQRTPNVTPTLNRSDESSPQVIDEFRSGHQLSRPATMNGGPPLPQAILKRVRFKLHSIPQHLENPFLQSALQGMSNGRIDVRHVMNDKFTTIVQPVWKEETFREFWLTIFNQASMLNLYFVYFIDKAVNISKRSAEIVVNREFDSNHSSTSLTSNSSSPMSNQSLSPNNGNYSEFFYNPDDLKKLTRLLYITYGRVLRALRESIANYHVEYPIKMSMFSAWACFWNTSSDVSTLCMMFTGALTLAIRLLNEAQSISEVSIAVRQEIMILNGHSSASIFPDYLLRAIGELSSSFHAYKRIVSDLMYNFENGLVKYDDRVVAALRNPLFRHSINEMSTFLKKLQFDYIPQMQAINAYYLKLYSLDTTVEGFKFVSPSLLYNLVFDWFRIFRGDKFSLVGNTSIVHRTVCVFYHALGRCLAMCITPIRSIMLLDPCNVIAPKTGFEIPEPPYEPFPEFQAIYQIDASLTRMIKFFDYRQAFIGYHIGHTLISNYVEFDDSPVPEEFEYKDIIRIKIEKLQVAEVQPASLMSGTFNVHNFPIFDEISQDGECYHLLRQELDRQALSIRTEPLRFDYQIGLLNHDFQPDRLLEAYIRKRQAELMRDLSPGLEELRMWAESFAKSGNKLMQAIKKERSQLEATGDGAA